MTAVFFVLIILFPMENDTLAYESVSEKKLKKKFLNSVSLFSVSHNSMKCPTRFFCKNKLYKNT